MSAERVLTVTEAADRLRLKPDSLRRWLRDGKIKGVWMGSDRAGYRITESEVERILTEGPRVPE
jgi:excisionase family DNA binding protein